MASVEDIGVINISVAVLYFGEIIFIGIERVFEILHEIDNMIVYIFIYIYLFG